MLQVHVGVCKHVYTYMHVHENIVATLHEHVTAVLQCTN